MERGAPGDRWKRSTMSEMAAFAMLGLGESARILRFSSEISRCGPFISGVIRLAYGITRTILGQVIFSALRLRIVVDLRQMDDILDSISDPFYCKEEEYAEAKPKPSVIDPWGRRHNKLSIFVMACNVIT